LEISWENVIEKIEPLLIIGNIFGKFTKKIKSLLKRGNILGKGS